MYAIHMHAVDDTSGLNTLPRERLTVKFIFEHNDNWKGYRHRHRHELREVEVSEVEKMLRCKEAENGYITCYCENCDEYHVMTFGCNSRLCSDCGKRYTDQWAEGLAKRMFDCPHRHFVMGIASQLWPIFEQNRDWWKILMDSAIEVINEVQSGYMRCNIRAGAIVVLHSYGRDLQFKCHIHVLVTEGGFDDRGVFRHNYYFPAKWMRKTWQYKVLTKLKAKMDDTPENKQLIDYLFKRYKNGFYVWLPEESRISSKREAAKYIGRYIRHPAIANHRIVGYDGETVTFWYKDNNEVRHTVVMKLDEFIGSIVRHIPDRQFKMIRYYGVYCRKWVRKYRELAGLSSITQRKLGDFGRERQFKCPKCGAVMEKIIYRKKGPPKMDRFGEILDDWGVARVS